MKHTKGEWSVTRSKVKVVNKNGIIIADCDWTLGRDFTEEEMEANAKLIAASPELLEALIEIKKAADNLSPHADFVKVWELANKAIDKATL